MELSPGSDFVGRAVWLDLGESDDSPYKRHGLQVGYQLDHASQATRFAGL